MRKCSVYYRFHVITILLLVLTGGMNYAAGTPDDQWLEPIGSSAALADGDYVSEDDGLDTFYSFFIEVPPDTANLVVSFFDREIGDTHDLIVSTDTTRTRYELYGPDGTRYSRRTVRASASRGDDEWSSWSDMEIDDPDAGHWEIRVDLSSLINSDSDADETNVFGLRAVDTDSGTELNIYADSFVMLGCSDPTSRTYDFYPYITCCDSLYSNDFDADGDAEYRFTSRSGQFTATVSTVSGQTAWNSQEVSGWTDCLQAVDYGLWSAELEVNDPSGQGANNVTYYIGNYQSASPPPSGQPEDDTFRIYFPPYENITLTKPYVGQIVSHVSGPNPPANGSTTRMRVQVSVDNPTLWDITFSASNLVTAYVPSTRVEYAGNASVTQGSVTSQPSVGGSGNVEWNPGVVDGGDTATLSYDIDVTPQSGDGTIYITGTCSDGYGTTAVYVDETGNTTQARATMTFGPLSGLCTEVGDSLPTFVVVSGFQAFAESDGVRLSWQTAAESRTVGFNLWRALAGTTDFNRVNDHLLLALLHHPQGGFYQYLDTTAQPGTRYSYRLEEVGPHGPVQEYGPYTVGKVSLPEAHEQTAAYSRAPRQRAAAQPGRPVPAAVKRDEPVRAVKIAVDRDGIYFLSAAQIAGAFGMHPHEARLMLAGHDFALSCQGRAVAYKAEPALDGLLFYGQDLDNQYTSANVYWLEPGDGLAMDSVIAEHNQAEPSSGFSCIKTFEQDLWASPTFFHNPGADYWFWTYLVADDPQFGQWAGTCTLPALASATGNAELTLRFYAITDSLSNPDHLLSVSVNGNPIGSVSADGTGFHEKSLYFSQDLLQAGDNAITVTSSLPAQVPYGIVLFDSFSLRFDRAYAAAECALTFPLSADSRADIGGFAGHDIVLLDITSPRTPRLVLGCSSSGHTPDIHLNVSGQAMANQYAVADKTGLIACDTLVPVYEQSLKDSGNSVDYLVIAPADMAADAQVLADFHSDLQSRVVCLQDIYNAFAHGLPNPYAIRDFLQHAYATWQQAPAYVLLAGEGTFDYRDNQNYGDNRIPTLLRDTPYGLAPSDNAFAIFPGSAAPRMIIGRLPAKNSAELAVMIAKSINQGRGRGNVRVLLTADNSDGVAEFEQDSRALVGFYPEDSRITYLSLADGPLNEIRAKLFASLEEGPDLWTYVGHGGMDCLAQEGWFNTADIDGLRQKNSPILTAYTCYIGHFALPGFDSLAESLVLCPDKGVAAAWVPSGASLHQQAMVLARSFAAACTDGNRLGDAVRSALQQYVAEDTFHQYMVDTFILLGDPALEL